MTLDAGAPPAPPEEPAEALPTDVADAGGGWSGLQVVGLVAVVAVVAVIAGVVLAGRVGAPPGADSVDVGFMQDMTTHHEQAVQMASIAAENGDDPIVRDFAREVLIFQQKEIGYMEALLEDWGQWPFPTGRTAMTWMGMSSTPEQMPGMQPDDAVRAMRDITGPAADAEFLRRMTDHHRGGIHMAEYAAANAEDPRVRDLAARMARVQQSEIQEYQQVADRLGIAL